MAHIDRVAAKPWFRSSFFSSANQTGLFETLIVSFGGLAISVFLIVAFHM